MFLQEVLHAVAPRIGKTSTRMTRVIEPTVIWATSDGVRCVVAPYDETRYQLRLLRAAGTVKADLFASVADANRAARRWRAEMNKHDSAPARKRPR